MQLRYQCNSNGYFAVHLHSVVESTAQVLISIE